MHVLINDQQHPLAAARTLLAQLDELGIAFQHIAIAVNERVIHREQWSGFELNSGDRITVIQATAGG